MQGQVLAYDPLAATGVISGSDGTRYSFGGSDWKGQPNQLRVGSRVDFEPRGTMASDIYAMVGSGGGGDVLGDEKSHLVAGLLALFLGSLGIHKFYMGYSKEGVILLVSTVVSWMLTVVLIGILGLMAIGIVCLIEAIIYLTKGQDEFRRIYIEGHKSWF